MATTFSAYSVYWYDESVEPAVGYGMAGRIRDNGSVISAVPNMRTNLNGDPKVEGFLDTSTGNNLRIAVTDRVASVQRPVYFHDAVSGAQIGNPQTWPEENLYTLVRLGNYLYAIDYDNAKVIEINASTYIATGVSYTLESKFIPVSGYQAFGQALTVINNKLYGLFTFADSTWSNYANSLLVRFTVDSGVSITVTDTTTETAYNANLAPNAFSFAVKGEELYIAAIGGRQTTAGYNSDSRLQKIVYGTTKLADAMVCNLLTPGTALPYDIRDISFKGSTAYVLLGKYTAGPTPTDPWPMVGKLVSTTDFVIANFNVIDDFSTSATAVLGYYWSAQYTPDNDRVWFARGNEIWVYDANNLPATVGTLPMNTLNGGGSYDSLNDLTYVGVSTTVSLRGYRSPLQRSNTPFAHAARALTRGRPELTEEEFQQLQTALQSKP